MKRGSLLFAKRPQARRPPLGRDELERKYAWLNLCSYAFGTPWQDQKQGKPYFDDRSTSVRSRWDDRTAKLTHEDRHVFGATFLGNLRRILILHTHAVIGDGQLNLVADLFHAQHDTSCPVRKGMLDGVRRKLIDQKAEGYST